MHASNFDVSAPMPGAIVPSGGAGPPDAPPQLSAPTQGLSSFREVWMATWSTNGLLLSAGYDRQRFRSKLRAVRMLVDSNDVVTLQETHGMSDNLAELLKMFPDCWACGTFADSRNAGGTAILPRLSFLLMATSVVSQPIEPRQSIRLMIDFSGGSLNVIAIHSDPSQALGLRRHWLRQALEARGESGRVLTLALDCLSASMPDDGRFDLADGARDYPIGVWLQEVFRDSCQVAHEGCSRPVGGRAGFVFDLLWTILSAICHRSPSSTSSRRRNSPGSSRTQVHSDHVPLSVRVPVDLGRPLGRRGWPAWLFQTAEFVAAVARLRLSDVGMATDLEYARGMLQAAAARELPACALSEARTDEERLYWGRRVELGAEEMLSEPDVSRTSVVACFLRGARVRRR